MNTIWRCVVGEEKLLVRINPDVDILPVVDRDMEIRVMEVLGVKGLCSPVYAR